MNLSLSLMLFHHYQEEELRASNDPKYQHLHEELHVEITAFAPPAEAHARLAYALTEVRKYLIPDSNDEIRQEQMREMEILAANNNGGTTTNANDASNVNLSMAAAAAMAAARLGLRPGVASTGLTPQVLPMTGMSCIPTAQYLAAGVPLVTRSSSMSLPTSTSTTQQQQKPYGDDRVIDDLSKDPRWDLGFYTDTSEHLGTA